MRLNFGVNKTELITDGGQGPYELLFFLPTTSNYQENLKFGMVDNHMEIGESEINMFVHPGYTNEVILEKIIQESLGKPYNECEDKKKSFSNYSVDTKKSVYRQVNCVQDCLLKELGFENNCLVAHKCENIATIMNQNMTLIEQIKTGCKAECPLECTQITFPVKRLNYNLDIQEYLLGYYRQNLLQKFELYDMSTEEFKNRLLLARFYYERQETTYIKQSSSMSTIDLAAAIGGLLGL